MLRINTKGKTLLALVIGFTIMASCASQTVDVDLRTEQQNLEMTVGESAVLTVNQKELDDIVWRSSDSNVAVVDQLGEIKAVGPGTAVIIVKAGGKTATTKVIVSYYRMTPDKLEVFPGETKQIQITPTPSVAYWHSEDQDIAIVDQSGSVTGVAPGRTKVSSRIGDRIVGCEVTVFGIAPDKIIISIGETKQVQHLPDGDTVVWASEDNGIAVVDQSGNVTAVAPGNTRVFASIDGKKAVCEVMVLPLELGKHKVAEVPLPDLSVGPPIFSPDGEMFVYYLPGAPGQEALLMDLHGNEFTLPGFYCGPISWRETRLVWHASNGMFVDTTYAIYVYETQDHSYIEINLPDSFDPGWGLHQVVLSNDKIVSMVLPDGLWNYDLKQESWVRVSVFKAEVMMASWPTLIWSPDLKKVAWLEVDRGDILLVLLDVDSGTRNIIHRQTQLPKTIIHLAWSEDSTKLALAGGGSESLSILSLDGDVIMFYPIYVFMYSLDWVPGQNMVAYATKEGLIINNLTDNNRWFVSSTTPYLSYTWLQNGNLARVDQDGYSTHIVLEIFELDWR